MKPNKIESKDFSRTLIKGASNIIEVSINHPNCNVIGDLKHSPIEWSFVKHNNAIIDLKNKTFELKGNAFAITKRTNGYYLGKALNCEKLNDSNKESFTLEELSN